MWHVIAEEDFKCRECYHYIDAGTECLSQTPPKMPAGLRRSKFENYCLNCPECDANGSGLSCFARRLSHWYAPKATAENEVLCGHCNQTIPKGTRTVAQNIYTWPNDEMKSASNGTNPGGPAAAATATTAANPTSGWEKLSPATQRKISTAGLGGPRGTRTLKQAQQFYEYSIPQRVRNAGERAVLNFLRGKEASHIRSVRNAPHLTKTTKNIIWEHRSRNQARGGSNMTLADQKAARSANINSAVTVGMKAAFRRAAFGGVIAMIMEGPVAGLENCFHCRRGRKTSRQATQDAVKSTAVATGAGAATSAILPLILPSLGPVGLPLMIAGGALWVGTTVHRVASAARHDLPIAELYVFFCKNRDCHIGFALAVTSSGLGHGPRSMNAD